MENWLSQAEKIQGWMSLPELEWLYETSKRMESIVELGCFEGRSTLALCSGCPGTVYAIDCHWCGTMYPFYENAQYTRPAFDRNVGHFQNLVALEMNFDEAAKLDIIPAMVDMPFLDGDHAKESVLLDIQTWWPRTIKMLCGHDYAPETPGVEAAINEYFGPGKVSRGPGSLWYIEK